MNQHVLTVIIKQCVQFIVYGLCGIVFYSAIILAGHAEEMMVTKNVDTALQQAEAAFNQEHYVQALAHYMNAKKYAPYGAWRCIDKNIDSIYKKLDIPPQTNTQEKCMWVVLKATSFFSIAFFKVIFLFFWYILFVLIVFFTWVHRRFFIFLISAVLLFFIVLFGCRYYIHSLPYAIVQHSVLRAGPGENYHDLGVLNTATTVLIERQKNDFYLVRNKAVKGWLKKEDVYIF